MSNFVEVCLKRPISFHILLVLNKLQVWYNTCSIVKYTQLKLDHEFYIMSESVLSQFKIWRFVSLINGQAFNLLHFACDQY